MCKRWSAAAVCAVALVGLSAGPARGGEITGNGKLTPVKAGVAASICSFSGLEDEAASPLLTQTPHEVWLGPEIGVVNPPPGTPGTDCRPGAGE